MWCRIRDMGWGLGQLAEHYSDGRISTRKFGNRSKSMRLQSQSMIQRPKRSLFFFFFCPNPLLKCQQKSSVNPTPEHSFVWFRSPRVSYRLHSTVYTPWMGHTDSSLSTPCCLLPPSTRYLHLSSPVFSASSNLYIVLRATVKLMPFSRLVEFVHIRWSHP